MNYKWKPSKSQRREFAIRMQDPVEVANYEQRKLNKIEKRRANSNFDYSSAGGHYVPTKAQYDFCAVHPELFNTPTEQDALNNVSYGYLCNEKIHHDFIHIVNEKIRSVV